MVVVLLKRRLRHYYLYRFLHAESMLLEQASKWLSQATAVMCVTQLRLVAYRFGAPRRHEQVLQ